MNTTEKDYLLVLLFQAYYEARKHKRNTINQLQFELNYESELVQLRDDLVNRTYQVKPSIAFIIDRPIKREVLAASFRDRVVHHLLFGLINPVFEPRFIEESFSCRKGKGTLYGVNTLRNSIIACSKNYTKECYVLKLDIKGYFMSIDKEILQEKLQKVIKNAPLLEGTWRSLSLQLIEILLKDHPISNCIIRGSKSDWKGLPPSKSLFYAKEGCGLPIGNLTSQLFSNIYLNDFDHFIKENLGFQYYGRYVDDIFLVHTEKQRLIGAVDSIRQYLRTSVHLELHPNKIYLQECKKGVPFLGAVIKPGRTYVSNRTKSRFNQQISFWSKKTSIHPPNQMEIIQLRSVLNSYLGLLSHYRTYNIKKRVLFKPEHLVLLNFGYLKSGYQKRMTFHLYKEHRSSKFVS